MKSTTNVNAHFLAYQIKTMKIITNNPMVQLKYPEKVDYLEAGVESVMIAARDRVHSGAKLLNHPLSGSLMPGVCPYKSLIVSAIEKTKTPQTDFASLGYLENAIDEFKKRTGASYGFDAKTLEDFQIVDLDLLDSALSSVER